MIPSPASASFAKSTFQNNPTSNLDYKIYTLVAHFMIINSALIATVLTITALVLPLSSSTIMTGTTTCIAMFVSGAYFMPSPPNKGQYLMTSPVSSSSASPVLAATPKESSNTVTSTALVRLESSDLKVGATPSTEKKPDWRVWFGDFFVDSKSPPVQAYALDSNMASKEEVALAHFGLFNPSNNCFMNASLQTLFQDSELSAFLMDQLRSISEAGALSALNPCLPAAPRCSIEGSKAEDRARLAEKKDTLIAELLSDHRYVAIATPLVSYHLHDVLETDLSNKVNLAQLYMTGSIKQMATYAYNLLAKWQTKSYLSHNEAVLLRLSLVKLMNREASIRLKPANDKLSDRAEWLLPGLNSENMSILISKMEEASEFCRLLIDSLDDLCARFLEESPHNPVKAKISCEVKAFRLPEADSEVAVFDPSLQIDGALKRHSHFDTTLQLTASAEGKYRLDDMSYFSGYTAIEKPLITYASFDELIPATHIGDTVSESTNYTIELPSKLLMWIQAGNGATKYKNTELQFTDQEALSVTLRAGEHLTEDSTYLLSSFTVHKGSSLMSGHYISYSRVTRADGRDYWLKQDDSNVRACPVAEVKAVLMGLEDWHSPNMLILKKV
jgi:hypothetical protein